MRSEGQSVFWLFIKEHLSSSEIKTYNSLHNVMTDVGRAQAWLRSSLNEQSLEKYLHSFIGHKQLLFQYYEQDALLLDDERSSMLPMMAADSRQYQPSSFSSNINMGCTITNVCDVRSSW
ncbi:sorting nexin-29-like isoform X3 [Xenia sp. Carnegie-2017]|uniref:sorting nexin-29-like isoform X3 n=1 Tax=Xenia sp. Carnegie-2017 TaxID=2897299 RepID=UPI001F046F8B|nr:sorting nexin-29-like isoform X3 [Xenia sp. Carnegie-2017]